MRDIQIRGLTSWLVLLCLNTIWRNMSIWKRFRGQNAKVLDVGCGRHSFISEVIKSQKFDAVGLDIFEPNVKEAKSNKVYRDVIVGDARQLPFKDKEFDLSVSIEVLEHLDKEDGEKALAELERVSRETVLITTPVGKSVHHAYYGNPYEEHKYIWSLEELKAKGFAIRGKGIKGLTAGDKWWLSLPMFMSPLQYAVYIIGTLFSYFILDIAESVIAWKDLEAVKC